jgi:UDPglucose--hexose-1-phosphate uridylyltransferase
VIAPRRASRPGISKPRLEDPTSEELETCPFCAGREDRTPPETFALPEGREPDTPGWQVRVVPNLYPAFERQEVVVHTPRHARSIAELDEVELELVAQAWKERWHAALDASFGYIHAVINEGQEAGASLPHSHSQLVWLHEPPPAAREENVSAFGEYVQRELADGRRVVLEREGVAVLCPYASRVPYELLVIPIEHHEDAFNGVLLEEALIYAAEAIRRLQHVEGHVPLNLWLHDTLHWHIEVVPRLTVFAGVELGAGIYVNPLPPEQAAQALREARS